MTRSNSHDSNNGCCWGVGVLEALEYISVWGIKNCTWNDILLSLNRLFCKCRQILQYCPATSAEMPLFLLGRNIKVQGRKSRDVYLQALNSHHHHYHNHHPSFILQLLHRRHPETDESVPIARIDVSRNNYDNLVQPPWLLWLTSLADLNMV